MSDDLKPRPHQVLESRATGQTAIKLTEEPYSGIIFNYDRVEFVPDDENDKLHIKFEYDIVNDNGVKYVKEELETYLGDFLQELIMYGILNNDLIYTGGVDENRTKDSEQSDS
jgi:3-oxoacyl-ACP reductase-like protein